MGHETGYPERSRGLRSVADHGRWEIVDDWETWCLPVSREISNSLDWVTRRPDNIGLGLGACRAWRVVARRMKN